MKRKLLIIIVLLIGLFTITGCEQKEKTDADIFKEEYSAFIKGKKRIIKL